MTRGERIKHRRQELGMSQTELADTVGITKQQMYKYENDIITNIPSDKIELIATALHTTPAYLMGWDAPDSGSRFSINGGDGKASKPIGPSALSGRDLRFALWGDSDDMDDEDLKAVLDYAAYVQQKKQKDK